MFDLQGGLQQARWSPGVRGLAALGTRLYVLDDEGIVGLDVRSGFEAAEPRRWRGPTDLVGVEARGDRLLVRRDDGAMITLDRDLDQRSARQRKADRWIAEPWSRGAIRPGGLFVKVDDGRALVYRCAQRRVF
jgi:hypothetical protein